MQNYTVYHLHTEDSLLDSCTNYQLYVNQAVKLNQNAICFTEHGNIFNWIEKKIYCESFKVLYGKETKKFGSLEQCNKFIADKGITEYEIITPIKYIHGIECYLTESLDEKIRDNYHTILIAKNYEGFKELNLLIDLSTQSDHFYYKPRITFDEFLSISDNVIKISACLASPLNKLRKNYKDLSNTVFEKLISKYDFLEIQPHINSQEQKDYNKWLVDTANKYSKPLIAGTDTHSLNSYKAECRSILQKAKKIQFSNEDEFDLTYKSYDELVEMFEKQGILDNDTYRTAIENTNVMANSVEAFTLDTSFKYPKLYGDEDETVMKHRISTMYKDKLQKGIIKDNPKYKTKILEEMRVFKKVGMVGFMLFMSELVCYCWENNIPIGFCRGSVGGSEIAYITDIIDVDPVIWNTVFSRFCNEDRKEIGDIDIDVSPTQRHLVYEYIINRFGADKTAYILAMGTVSDKGTIDEICRALEVSLSDAERIKKEYDINPEATKKKYPNVFYYFDGLLNTTVSQSMHPAGIIASPVSLPDNYGTFWSDGKRILSINMEEVHEVSLVKYDILGLKNIEICKDACEYANINYPKSHEINWNDENVWNDITSSPVGIFQFEGDYAADLLKKYLPRKINDLSLVNASLRPSGASYRDRLIAREKNHNPSQLIDDLLADNDGFLVFQEDCIKFLKDICGLSGSDADNVRRAIGRKQADRLQAALPQILEGYCNKSPQPREVAEKEAKVFLQIIEDSSNYQFGFNHSTGYSMIGYLCAYLRYYYSIEFITSYLNNANNEADIANGTMLAKQKGIKIFPIKFRHSKDTYSPDKKNNAIYKGIASVKFLNADVAKAMYEMRDTQFDSFIDFLRVNPCNSRQTEILIKLDFFSEFGKSQKLLTIYDIYNNYYDKKQFKKDKLTLPEETVLKYSTATDKMYKITDMNGLISELLVGIENKSIPLSQRLQAELEYLGYIDYINDKSPEGLYYVMEYKTYNDKCKPYVTLYHLKTGESIKTKVTSAKEFSLHPFKQGNILNVWFKDKYKSKMIDGKWVKTDELEKVINTWEVY